MLTELDRRILKLILEEKEPISAKKLASYCNVSINTVRKELDLLNGEMSKHGFVIESKSSVGMYPVVQDARLADPYICRLRETYNRIRRMDNRYDAVAYYLARRCLCAHDNLTVDKLCDELYCSRGTLLKELEQTRELLEDFHLSLKNRRRGYGLAVEGTEWDIRQCMVYLHKVYMVTTAQQPHAEWPRESDFLIQFLTGQGEVDRLTQALGEGLAQQQDFYLPVLHLPKVINTLLLCVSRKKYADELSFTQSQIARAQATGEYRFVCRLCEKLPSRLREAMQEKELLCVTMILLCYETQNNRLPEKEQYPAYCEETELLIERLIAQFDFSPEQFDTAFRQDFICGLYRFDNQRSFGVYGDTELVGQVRLMGISTSHVCLAFARFYKERHNIALSRGAAMSFFFLFNRILSRNRHCYYAQRILVVSQYGVTCARSIAEKLLRDHREEILCAQAEAYHGIQTVDRQKWDLLLTDMGAERKARYFPESDIPVLSVEFWLEPRRCRELDAYLLQLRQMEELKILRRESFLRTNFGDKQAVFEGCAALFEPEAAPRATLAEYLRENDALVELERENGIVFLPILAPGDCAPQIWVLLNRRPFVWNRRAAQLFICYRHSSREKDDRVLASILHHFLYLSPASIDTLLNSQDQDPVLLLYPDE